MSIKSIGPSYKPSYSYKPQNRTTPTQTQKAVRKIGNEIQRIGWQTDYIRKTNQAPPRPISYGPNLNRYSYKK